MFRAACVYAYTLIHSKQNSYCLTFSNNSLTMRIFQNLKSCFMSGQLTDVIHGNYMFMVCWEYI